MTKLCLRHALTQNIEFTLRQILIKQISNLKTFNVKKHPKYLGSGFVVKSFVVKEIGSVESMFFIKISFKLWVVQPTVPHY